MNIDDLLAPAHPEASSFATYLHPVKPRAFSRAFLVIPAEVTVDDGTRLSVDAVMKHDVYGTICAAALNAMRMTDSFDVFPVLDLMGELDPDAPLFYVADITGVDIIAVHPEGRQKLAVVCSLIEDDPEEPVPDEDAPDGTAVA